MGKPAARLGDMTVHGGSIVVGCPNVLIGGKPAARVGDMHVCPMLNPGTPPPPHVGGPVMPPGVPIVLIGGMPAACIGDMATCAGPPDSIAPPGCPTVLIGTSGGGGGGGGGAGKSGDKAKASEGKGGKGDSEKGESGKGSAASSKAKEEEIEEEEGHFLDVKFFDKGGFPITGPKYSIKTPEDKKSDGNLVGAFKKTGVKEGDYEIELKAITKAEWSKKEAKDGETVKMLVETAGIEDGTKATIEVWEKDFGTGDRLIKIIKDTTITGNSVEAEWMYEYKEDEEDKEDEGEVTKYSSPQYYFIIKTEDNQARSGILDYKDWIEISLEDEDGNPMADEEYILYLSSGEIRKGKLDSKGYKKEKNIPTKNCRIHFPKAGETLLLD
jgi:uncharacterized Zn-binding protein involved in type VI secretion